MQKKMTFFSNWKRGVSGTERNGIFNVKNDFTLRIISLVEAEQKTGYFANVKREQDQRVRYALLLLLYAATLNG